MKKKELFALLLRGFGAFMLLDVVQQLPYYIFEMQRLLADFPRSLITFLVTLMPLATAIVLLLLARQIAGLIYRRDGEDTVEIGIGYKELAEVIFCSIGIGAILSAVPGLGVYLVNALQSYEPPSTPDTLVITPGFWENILKLGLGVILLFSARGVLAAVWSLRGMNKQPDKAGADGTGSDK